MRLFTWVSIGMGLAAVCGCSVRSDSAAIDRPSDPPMQVNDATWEPPEGLQFLRSVPELRGVSLAMREPEFQELVKSRGLKVRPDRSADQTSYWISTDSGENVIVMFRNDGTCRGIQRMWPTPSK